MGARFTVDEMGNCWALDDTEFTKPVRPHVELSPDKARCPDCGAYVFRVKTDRGDFEWKCSCGRTFPGLHH